ncbi:MAG TPA: FkbM family methyltransferase [Solirubrobacteraceae bacterium]|nr:FkbM family methyltransferase [Solirubrobacteraceae bacterium]
MLRVLWQALNRVQHSGTFGRRVIETATHPIRHRDLRIMRGSVAGARINLGGSFLRYLTGDAEPEVQSALAELIEPGQTVYDVGANIGFFTILCSRLVGPHGSVYAFEPIPENLVTLRHNIALNRLTNVVVVEQALSSSTGTAEMFVSPWSAFHSLDVAGASKRENHGPDGGQVTVETVTLDEFVQRDGVSAPDLVKLDVEGAELLVAEGMRETLRTVQPLLLVEVHDTNREYAEFVDSIDYRVRVIDGEEPALADAGRNPHTIAWPQARDMAGTAVCG